MTITVAITTYNALAHLQRVLAEVKAQGFTDIVTLDDNSDDGTRDWLRGQGDVRTVLGEENLGPTGNRNRMHGLESGEIILFLDVDMELVSETIRAKLGDMFQNHAQVGVVGPLILSNVNEPMWYNTGYDFAPHESGFTEALNAVALAHWGDTEVMATVRKLAQGRVGHFEPIRDREVDWIVEQFFAVRRTIFDELNGFDPQFRMFHEGPDFCLRARQAGYNIWFTASITVKHLDLHSADDEQRAADMARSTRYYYHKHYDVPDEIITRFFLG